jgi:hypothetical protein
MSVVVLIREKIMQKQTKKTCLIGVVFLSLLFLSSFALAKGKGKGGSGSPPHGWTKGKKTGWNESVVPPGIDKHKADSWSPPGVSKDQKAEEGNGEASGTKDQKRLHKRERKRERKTEKQQAMEEKQQQVKTEEQKKVKEKGEKATGHGKDETEEVE